MISEHPERQVLVVGDTVVGLSLALLLRRAGYDPIIARGRERSTRSRVTYLCPPALRAFDAIGIGASLRESGSAVSDVVLRGSTSRAGDATVLSRGSEPAEPLPLVVRTERLRRELEARLPPHQRRVDQPVETLDRRDGGLAVRFGDGIREWFDAVVDAGGGGESLRSARDGPPTVETLSQYEIPVDTDAHTRGRLRELWRHDAIVQRFRSPNGTGEVLRITAPASSIVDGLDDGYRGQFFPEAGPDVGPDRTEFEPVDVRQAELSDVAPEWWGTGRVSFCGPAVCPVAPAGGFDTTFGIEDAVAFVRELTGTAGPVADVVERFSSRRARRLTRIRRMTDAPHSTQEFPTPWPARSPLASLGALRAVTLGSFLGARMGSLQREGFTPA